MDAPPSVTAEKPGMACAEADAGLDALSMETVEFELALQLRAAPGKKFETAVSEALASVGGKLLFHMPVEGDPDCRHVAAVSLPAYESRTLALVIEPREGDPRVELADRSSNPLARIVGAYAGLLDCLTL